MVLYRDSDHPLQADVVFVIEATAVNGAYINDIRSNYILPCLEYFSQGSIDENNYMTENANCFYGIVTYQASDCLPHLCTETYGPYSSPSKVLTTIEKLELIGGKGESHANVAEGLATALSCFEELGARRDPNYPPQKHCILICNSAPYSLPVLECQIYTGKGAEQLAVILSEKAINLSIISPRKIPQLYKLFEKSGGDLSSSQSKNYSKDPRHLVLLKGFSLKERPISPINGPPSNQQIGQPTPPHSLGITSSPIGGNDSPIHNSQQNPNMLGTSPSTVGPTNPGQNPIYRAPGQNVIPNVMMRPQNSMQMGMPNMPAPPGYPTGPRGPNSWQMPPPSQQPRPYMQPNQQNNPSAGGSALIAQLQQPPSIPPNANVGQFNTINTNSPLGNKINMGQTQVPNIQTSMAQNSMIQNSSTQASASQGQQGPQANQPGVPVTSQAQGGQQAPQQMGTRERQTIWQGMLEWIEKPKLVTDMKITRHVPCQVSANAKDGEPEMKADGWPQKLIMQLMPKHLIGNIGGSYLKNSKSVLFHPTPCEALENLTRVMVSGFAGCVHFTSNANPAACDIKVLILLYTADKRAYLGFIPNDQAAFVERLRKVIQQQKSTQNMRPPGNAGPTPGLPGTQQPGQLPIGQNQPQQMNTNPQTSQSGILIPPTNTITLNGGQITQNNPQQGQNVPQMGGIMGQNVPPLGPGPSQQMGQANMMGGQVQRPPAFENQLQVERQQNLDKINKLKQTLQEAQQQEQQYKSQLERISHMKTSHLQEALQQAQNTEMQFKMLEQQRQQQQQRMMRPMMANNPGLRHLLQQQPQFRQPMLNMNQMGAQGGRPQMGQQMPNAQGNPPNTFDDVGNFDFM